MSWWERLVGWFGCNVLGQHEWQDRNAGRANTPLDVRCACCGLRYVDYRWRQDWRNDV